MRASLVTLILGLAGPATAETLELIGSYNWDTSVVFGLSGLEVSRDGSAFVTVSDRGFWTSGTFQRQDDVIAGVDFDDVQPILGRNGLPVAARPTPEWADAEGLALSEDGMVWISFERWAHVAVFPNGLTNASRWLPIHPTFEEHVENWQLEALAVSPEGGLYTFSEKPLANGFPIYHFDGKQWTIEGYLPEQDLFSIVGADFAENGDLYLLERKLVVGLWWQNRIRRVRLDGSLDEILWTGERGEFLNLEGIAVWYHDEGLRLTLVADNNGKPGDPTQFVEFRLTE